MRLRVLDCQIVNFFHVHFQMVGSFKDLTARFARMRHKTALVLVTHVPQQRALQVEHTRTDGTLKFCALWRLTHAIDRVCVG